MRILVFAVLLPFSAARATTGRGIVHQEAVAAASETQFERMKALVGTWQGTASAEGQAFPVEIRYRLTAAGRSLAETLFPGDEHEMVSLYHRDGPWLMMTHYCAGGNQPRMRAVQTEAPQAAGQGRIRFEFLDATNMASREQAVMHDVLFEFDGPDHMQATWTSFEGEKPGHAANFDVRRVGT